MKEKIQLHPFLLMATSTWQMMKRLWAKFPERREEMYLYMQAIEEGWTKEEIGEWFLNGWRKEE